MKTPLEILKDVSEWQCHRMASIPFHGDLELVIDAMKCYAAKYHESEVLKLNKAFVMAQLPTIGCVHDWTQISLQWNKCDKCGMFVPVGNLP